MARPKKPTSDKREQWVKARVSPAEHADILVRAAGAGVSASEFLRRAALSGEVVVQPAPEGDFETVDQLRRIGVNLNQLARVANRTGYLPDGLEEAVAKVDRLLDRMMES
ncbi:MAG: plasmid mobilization relaxosome protein MobC [Pseudomonadota bacterium]